MRFVRNLTLQKMSNLKDIVRKLCKIKYTERDFSGGPVIKNLPANVGGMGLIPGSGGFYMLWSN